MHPRERVLGLAKLLASRGEQFPDPLIDEAERLNISLACFVKTEEVTTKPTTTINKESPDGSES